MPINIKANIKKISSVILATALLSFSAPMPAWSENVGPFGFEVGEDKFEGINDRLDRYYCKYGISEITSGKIAVCPSKKFDLDGLPKHNKVIFIFNEDSTLICISMVLFDNFDIILSSLSSKYEIVLNKDGLIENHAILKSGNVNIYLNNNFKQSGIELIYSTDEFDKKIKNYNEKKQKDKINKQVNQL